MIIQLRVRVNKTPKFEKQALFPGDQFIQFDNCDQVRFSIKPVDCDRKTFEELRAVDRSAKGAPTYHLMLKDPRMCGANEEYHYNIISWRDRVTGQLHELRFDTVVFLQNDQGQPLRQLKG